MISEVYYRRLLKFVSTDNFPPDMNDCRLINPLQNRFLHEKRVVVQLDKKFRFYENQELVFTGALPGQESELL